MDQGNSWVNGGILAEGDNFGITNRHDSDSTQHKKLTINQLAVAFHLAFI